MAVPELKTFGKMKITPIFFSALVVSLSACTFTHKPSTVAPISMQEKIGKAILENKFAEQESEYAKHHQKQRAGKDEPDPFGGAAADNKPDFIYEPYCVRISDKDPSARFLKILDRRQHPIKPGSSFKPHLTKFSSSEARLNFELSNPAGLFSIPGINLQENGNTAVVRVVIYRHGLNSEMWTYILRIIDGNWTVSSKEMTHIS